MSKYHIKEVKLSLKLDPVGPLMAHYNITRDDVNTYSAKVRLTCPKIFDRQALDATILDVCGSNVESLKQFVIHDVMRPINIHCLQLVNMTDLCYESYQDGRMCIKCWSDDMHRQLEGNRKREMLFGK